MEYRGGPTRRMLLTAHTRREYPSTVLTLAATRSKFEYFHLVPTQSILLGQLHDYLVLTTAILFLVLVFCMLYFYAPSMNTKDIPVEDTKKQSLLEEALL